MASAPTVALCGTLQKPSSVWTGALSWIVITIGLDLEKDVFQADGVAGDGTIAFY